MSGCGVTRLAAVFPKVVSPLGVVLVHTLPGPILLVEAHMWLRCSPTPLLEGSHPFGLTLAGVLGKHFCCGGCFVVLHPRADSWL